jgi:hypothetical protein
MRPRDGLGPHPSRVQVNNGWLTLFLPYTATDELDGLGSPWSMT